MSDDMTTTEEFARVRHLVVYHCAPWPVVAEIHRLKDEEITDEGESLD